MTSPHGPDDRLTAWLGDEAPAHAPDGLFEQVTRRAARTHHRPSWATSERWIPMETRAQFGAVPRAALMLIVLAVMLIVFSALAIGSGASPSPELPPPFGPAENGLIAYDSGGDIWVMDPDGSNQRPLTSGPAIDVGPVWSSDGTRIAYWSWPGPAVIPEGGSLFDVVTSNLLATDTGSIMIMDADGSDPPVIAAGPIRAGGDFALSWSPTAEQVVFARMVDSVMTLSVASVDGTPLIDLVPGAWPSWAPDGSLIAYTDPAIPSGVMVVAPDGTGAERVTQAAGSGAAFSRPRWSPDSHWIVYYAGADGSHDVWVVDRDGTGERAVARDPRDEYWPAWAPTGDRIVVSRVIADPNNRPTFVVVSADGQGELVLDKTPRQMEGNWGTWSPDGGIIVGGDWQPNKMAFDLHLIDAAGSSDTLVIPIAANVGDVSWQRIAMPPRSTHDKIVGGSLAPVPSR